MDAGRTILSLRGLTHTYPDGRSALNGVTLTVTKGERIALLGPNGAGKSTLFLRICGVLPGRPGQILVDEIDPALHRKKLPQTVGLVFQNPDDQLFSATVLEDVAFGPLNLGFSTAEAKRVAEEALVQVGLTGQADRPPHKLSGGEKRRAALAGVLVMKPEILLLDEPTGYLDPRGRRDLTERLTALETTLLLATHDLEFARNTCARAVILDGGKLVADGPVHHILGNPTLLHQCGLDSR